MNINVILAVIWIAGGIGLLIWEVFHPEDQWLTIRGTGISAGWLLLVLGAYNLVRWWNARSARSQRESEDSWGHARQRRQPLHREPPVIDPTFNFSEPPPDEPGKDKN